MKRWLLSVALLLAGIACIAHAQVPMTGAGLGKPSSGGGCGNVAYDSFADDSVSAGGSTLTWTHTPVGTPTAIAIALQNYTAAGSVTGVTYGGNALTRAVQQAFNGDATVEIWGGSGATIPSGAQSVVVTIGATGMYLAATSIAVTCSNTSTTFDASNSATNTSSAPSVAVTSTSAEVVVDVVGNVAAATETSNQTLIVQSGNNIGGNRETYSSRATGGSSSTTMSYVQSGSFLWAIAAASFKHQ